MTSMVSEYPPSEDMAEKTENVSAWSERHQILKNSIAIPTMASAGTIAPVKI
jgi:hypothetical protein